MVTANETLRINLGPQHPSTHGVLRLELELDGERVVSCRPVIGYLHTGIEKSMEARNWLHAITMTDRLDYLNPLGNNLAYALAVEALFDCEIPERAVVARVLLAELTRINSHLVWVGTNAMDLGALSVFLYAFRERELLLDLFEEMSGSRMMTSFIRPGGLQDDFPAGWLQRCERVLQVLPSRIDEYEALLTDNPLFRERTIGIGVLKADDALALGVSGPLLRASGVAHDLRKARPYCGYERFQFRVCTATAGDCYARYQVRIAELRESVSLCRQAIAALPGGPVRTADRKVMPPLRAEFQHSMEALIHHFKHYTEGLRPPAGEAYVPVESPRGELGFYVRSDGSGRPVRVHERAPSFANLQALPSMAKGMLIADLVAIISTVDPVLGEVDR
ncbi:MAG TPA: NADH dehydrogenase (quinone) subunit D [Planctomycetota bacterium]|nr:NADH dehydrogenase (quinone) subunit D [Planctomycetota bacterium]